MRKDSLSEVNKLSEKIVRLKDQILNAERQKSDVLDALERSNEDKNNLKTGFELKISSQDVLITSLKAKISKLLESRKSMTQRLRIQLAKLYDEYQESKDSILFIKTYQKQMLEDQTEELGSSMNKLKLNLM